MKPPIAAVMSLILICCSCCYSVPVQSTDFTAAARGSERSILLFLAGGGIGRRIRTLLDWYQVALQSDRALVLIWNPSVDCNATFGDLFESGPEKLLVLSSAALTVESAVASITAQELSYDVISSSSFVRSDASVTGPIFDADDFAGVDSEERHFLLRRSAVMGAEQVVVTTHYGAVALEGQRCEEYLAMHSQLFQQFQPLRLLRETAEEFLTTYFSENVMVGVHLRGHDALHDSPTVPFAPKARRFGEGALVDNFITTMWTISEYERQMQESTSNYSIGRHENASKRIRFYVATNSNLDKRLILEAVNNAFSLSGSLERSSLDGVQFAFIEWLVLTNSELLIHTYGSAYGAEAAAVRQRATAGIWDGLLVHHSNSSLPFCGHPRFVKSYSNHQGLPITYLEGSADPKKILSSQIPLMPCDALSNWGLQDVLCTITDTKFIERQ